ncbi:hypothetical protein AALA80_11385 [Oscillospiraceae bacterium 50-60]
MSVEENHNKIISRAAQSVLRPMGLFRKGQSRLWVDDNGWFLILVEFQPSGWDRGTYLNVGIHYLWHGKDYLSFDYGYRVHEFVSFCEGEREFEQAVVSLAEQAAETVLDYRGFRDISQAVRRIEARCARRESQELYDRMMICGLARSPAAADYGRRLAEDVKHSSLRYETEDYREWVEEIAPLVRDRDGFYEYIVEKVSARREFWRGKAGMKKLAAEWEM